MARANRADLVSVRFALPIQSAYSFLREGERCSKNCLAAGAFASAALSSWGSATVRSFLSTSITTATTSPLDASAPFCSSLPTIIEWLPSPSGIREFLKGWPFIVPDTGTRALLPKTRSTLNGIGRNVHAPEGPRPTNRALNVCFMSPCPQIDTAGRGPRQAYSISGVLRHGSNGWHFGCAAASISANP